MNIRFLALVVALVVMQSVALPSEKESNSIWPSKKIILLLPDRVDEKRPDRKRSPDLVKALEAKGLVVSVVDVTSPSESGNGPVLNLTATAYLYFCRDDRGTCLYNSALCFDPEAVGNSLFENGYDGIVCLTDCYKGGSPIYLEASAWSWCVTYMSTEWLLTEGIKRTSWNSGIHVQLAVEERWFDNPVKAKQLIKSLSEMSIVSAPNDSTELAYLRLKLTRYDFPSFPLEGRHPFEDRIDTWLLSENRIDRDDGLEDLQRVTGWARMMSDSAKQLVPRTKSDAGKYFLSRQMTI